MRVYVEQAGDPWGEIRAWGEWVGAEAAWARVWNGNILASSGSVPLPTGPEHVIVWSGSMGDGLWSRHPGNWMSPGIAALDRLVGRVRSGWAPGAGGCWWLRPHCRHVLSDAPSVERFMRESGDERLGIALEPAALFEVEMFATRFDHLERILGTLGSTASAIIVSDRAAPRREGDVPAPCRLGTGLLNVGEMMGLIEKFVPSRTPVIVCDGMEPVDEARLGSLSDLLGGVVAD